jgi:predicted TIM-barrel fold metal-dependent hydrolase
MIVDVHCHLGWDYTFDEDFKKDDLVEKMQIPGVDMQIVQPGTCHDLPTVRHQHDAIAGLCGEFPGRFFGMANPSPHLPAEAYAGEIARCIQELGFTSIKLHPMAHGVNPGSQSGRKVFDAARRHSIPVMVHTGSGAPFADPTSLLNIAKEYPDVTIVMAHSGMLVFSGNAAKVFEACPNVYGDSTWTPGFLIKDWTRDYGPRIMFASDQADNTAAEIEKIRTCGLSEQEQRQVFSATAVAVFNLETRRTA